MFLKRLQLPLKGRQISAKVKNSAESFGFHHQFNLFLDFWPQFLHIQMSKRNYFMCLLCILCVSKDLWKQKVQKFSFYAHLNVAATCVHRHVWTQHGDQGRKGLRITKRKARVRTWSSMCSTTFFRGSCGCGPTHILYGSYEPVNTIWFTFLLGKHSN